MHASQQQIKIFPLKQMLLVRLAAKNFSLMTRDGKVELTPAYDILNTTIVLSKPQEEIALPIKGKKRKLDFEILIDYFGRNRLGLNRKTISSLLEDLKEAVPVWDRLINVSFLPDEMKREYRVLLEMRRERLLGETH